MAVSKTRQTFGQDRIVTHVLLALTCAAGCGLAIGLEPTMTVDEALALGSGYIALILLAVTLLIGPINLLRKRSNPVNINFRRDVAIWSGIAGLLHVVFGFEVYEGGQILQYFFKSEAEGGGLQWNVFGLSNFTGLAATIIMVGLLVISNQISLKWLKGKRWKFWQRFTYPMFALVLVHTIGYQIFNLREAAFTWAVLGLTLVVMAAQAGGVYVTLQREKRRQAGLQATPGINGVAYPASSSAMTPEMARRRFLTVTGTVVLGGLAAGASYAVTSRLLENDGAKTLPQTQADLGGSTAPVTPNDVVNTLPPTSTAVPPTPTQAAVAPTAPSGRRGGRPSNQPPPAPGQPAAPSAPGQPIAPPTTQPAASTNNQAPASNVKGTVLAKANSLTTGSAIEFTTPDTGERAFLIRETDGSFKALSGTCTHRPFDLVFDNSSQMLVCNLHNVPFNASTGQPTRFPARASLRSYQIAQDAQGNIVYKVA